MYGGGGGCCWVGRLDEAGRAAEKNAEGQRGRIHSY